jgi:3'-phosphoadenosine 5'-phosphosulfate sulfotransferase (PAPS reductase)/FAD synthetase
MAATGQDGLWTVRELTGPGVPADAPPLDGYHMILVNISGGKDSQATLDVTVAAADAAGVRDRIVVVFADLGEADEWPGTLELAREHAEHYAVRFEVVCREVTGQDGPAPRRG